MRLAPIETQNHFVRLLQSEYIKRCKKNPSYSLRAFGKFLEMHPASLSLMLRGKRKFSKKIIDKLSKKLELTPEQSELLYETAKKDNSEREHLNLTLDYFAICSEWYYDAILELATLDDFNSDPKWIAEILDLTISVVQIAIERLERLEFITITDDVWEVHHQDTELFVNEFTTKALKEFQKKSLELSQKALENVNLEKRYHSTHTLSINVSDMDKAKKILREVRNQFDMDLRSNEANDVYQLNISFYPVTNINQY